MRFHIFLVLLLAVSQPVSAKLFKWVDDQGNVQYSDKLPPSAVKKPYEKLDKHGLVIDRKGRAKTPEEIAEEERIKKLREETQRQIAEQQAKDRILLNTYRSEDDIILARDGKLATIDSQIRITYTNIDRLKERLSSHKKRAADLERRGKKIPAQLQMSIDNTRGEIKDSYASILRQEKDKNSIREKYEEDLARFRKLAKLKADNRSQSLAEQQRYKNDAIVKTVVLCKDAEHCSQLWEKAKTYARKHATTAVYVDSDRLFITLPPRKDGDLSITVSRLRPNEEQPELIFLDIQCKKQVLTDTWCKSPEAAKIRDNFRSAILGES